MSKQKEYNVMARMTLDISISVMAESLDAALEKSKKFDEHDFVEISGDYCDGTFRISGIYES